MSPAADGPSSNKADEALKVLVIDDNRSFADTMAEVLERVGYDCTVAVSGKSGVQKLEKEDFDVILTDLKLPDLDGLAVLRRARELQPEAEVVMITGHGDVKSAVDAIKQGASHYLTKPPDRDELRAIVQKASERLHLVRANAELKRQIDERFGWEGLIGNSPRMHEAIKQLQNFARTDATVLLLGETGTGKELAARALHHNSRRKNKPFVDLTVTTLNENLLDDDLFGHEPGSYTGADRMRKGRFEHANGGTLFLDEIGDMPLTLQAKLLKVLENREVIRIGSNEPIKVDVRLIAATHRDLKVLIAEGKFREDLYHRLKVLQVNLPPLRERREDIPLLATHFMRQANEEYDKEVKGIAEPLMQGMMTYGWPGNVRELRNLIHSTVVLDSDGILNIDDVQDRDVLDKMQLAPRAPAGPDSLVGRPLAEVERYYTERALELAGGNREEAARILGIGERTLYRNIKDWEAQNRIKKSLAEHNGNVQAVAQSLDMDVAELRRQIKKGGLLADETTEVKAGS
jgi:two-component system response regulator HydG